MTNTSARLAATAIGATSEGDGTLATITFTVVEAKDSAIGLEAIISDPTATVITPLSIHGGIVTGPDTGAIDDNQTVNIPDPNLRAAIEKTLDKASGATITTADMAKLTELVAEDANISDLTGLEAAINLTRLDLWTNNISDISAVARLTNLTSLNLNHNSIADISPLAGLKQPDIAESWVQQHLRHFSGSKTNQPDTAGPLDQQYLRHFSGGKTNQPDISESWEKLGIGHLSGGRANQPDIAEP